MEERAGKLVKVENKRIETENRIENIEIKNTKSEIDPESGKETENGIEAVEIEIGKLPQLTRKLIAREAEIGAEIAAGIDLATENVRSIAMLSEKKRDRGKRTGREKRTKRGRKTD